MIRRRSEMQQNVIRHVRSHTINHVALCTLDNFKDSCVTVQSNIGTMTTQCPHCHALLFADELTHTRICCTKGKIQLPKPLLPPIEYMRLFTDDTEQAKEFRKNIRGYNSAFCFTSLGADFDHNLASSRDGCFTFRIQGSMYHNIGPITPESNIHKPVYAQIYFQDTNLEAQIDRRIEIFPSLRRDTMASIQETLLQHHPYVHELRSIHESQRPYNDLTMKICGKRNMYYQKPFHQYNH